MRYFLLLLLPFFFATSCSDDEELSPVDQLPPATQTGENVFACLVDGEAWINTPNSFGFHNRISAGYYNSRVECRALKKLGDDPNSSTESSFGIRISPAIIGEATLDTLSIRYSKKRRDNTIFYYCVPSASSISITKLTNYSDNRQDIVAGSFEGVMVNTALNDTIIVSEGRFDVILYY